MIAFNKSDEEQPITEEMLQNFLCGDVDAEIRHRIQAEMKINGSAVQQWFAGLQSWAQNISNAFLKADKK